ncbi:forkhead box protein R1 isoform X1 [Pungitius pungitius]|uniref:forkhead box protein R1 isoform X1 n=1 Tax=Pungitius pungitius TaxID=134920 RepID=UPI002E1256BB
MSFQLRTEARLCQLHCCVGLTDWDMDKELKLATTTDQFHHDDKLMDQYVVQRPCARPPRRKDEFIWYDKTSDSFVKPNLWLLVNPSIACPIRHREPLPPPQGVPGPVREASAAPLGGPRPGLHEDHMVPCSLQTPHFNEMLGRSKMKTSPIDQRRTGEREEPRRRSNDASVVQDTKTLKPGCWPRPPVNYCILIALALKSSHTGGLKVQQIYNFTREHFPFFQTAPDGWKNTIRHNLCFNSSFRKTCNQLCRDGKRKSCFWHLTLDGQRRLRDDVGALTGESSRQLERSMSRPDVIQSLFAM